MENIALFKELGFTEREIKVYLALLELGTSTAGPIAVKSRLPQTKVYETLGRLSEKGLVNYTMVSKTKHFEAADPKEILNIIEERKSKFKEILKELELKRKYAKEKQIATVHEGFNAFKAMFNSIILESNKNDFYYAFALKEDYNDKTIQLFLRNFHKRLAEKQVEDKALVNYTVKNEVRKTFEGIESIQLRYVKRSMPVGVIILKNKIIQLVWGDLPTAIEIKSNQIAEQYKKFFLEMWNKN